MENDFKDFKVISYSSFPALLGSVECPNSFIMVVKDDDQWKEIVDTVIKNLKDNTEHETGLQKGVWAGFEYDANIKNYKILSENNVAAFVLTGGTSRKEGVFGLFRKGDKVVGILVKFEKEDASNDHGYFQLCVDKIEKGILQYSRRDTKPYPPISRSFVYNLNDLEKLLF